MQLLGQTGIIGIGLRFDYHSTQSALLHQNGGQICKIVLYHSFGRFRWLGIASSRLLIITR